LGCDCRPRLRHLLQHAGQRRTALRPARLGQRRHPHPRRLRRPSPPRRPPSRSFAPRRRSPTPTTACTPSRFARGAIGRLTAADYDSGEFFRYTYDSVGNRLLQQTHEETNTYAYDIANRLISVDGVSYTWDDKGNLLSDGERAYTYGPANRLTSVAMGADTFTFAYNGLGDRLRQTINAVPQNYTLDIGSSLTQVLSDEADAYLYGVGRIGQEGAAGWQYHLGDALASVRQVSGGLDAIGYAQAFEPYGSRLSAAGADPTSYGFTGEWMDASALMYLRARYYGPSVGLFYAKDVGLGFDVRPSTHNSWQYTDANPVNATDPSGRLPGTREAPSPCDGSIRDRECTLAWFAVSRTEFTERPPGITWAPSLTVNNATQVGAMQYYIRDPNNNYQPTAYLYGTEQCGQIVLSMILETTTGLEYQLTKIFESVGKRLSGTFADDLARALLDVFPKDMSWHAIDHYYDTGVEYERVIERDGSIRVRTYYISGDKGWSSQGTAGLISALREGTRKGRYLIPLVSIGYKPGVKDPGTLVPEKPAPVTDHWVLITGFSSEWQEGRPGSFLNWIRVKNPYRNRSEYYTWAEFESSWSSSRRLLEIWYDPAPTDPLIRGLVP